VLGNKLFGLSGDTVQGAQQLAQPREDVIRVDAAPPWTTGKPRDQVPAAMQIGAKLRSALQIGANSQGKKKKGLRFAS
jgi:hypothetical protein